MSENKKELLAQALKRHKNILPCSGMGSFAECFTIHDDLLLLWFNTSDGSTHMVKKVIPVKEAAA